MIAVAAGGGTVSIVRSDGESSDASIVGRDPLTDLAVLRAHDTSSLPVITLGDSGSLRVGEPVVALGSPLGLTSTVTTEIVSALNRYVRVPSENGQAAHLVGAIQTDASINPGNSGGALVDCSARLIGISRPTVGMQVQELSGASPGLFVAAVASGGPADKARIRPGDVIVEVDGEPARSVDHLIVKTLTMSAGDKIRLTYHRAGETHTPS